MHRPVVLLQFTLATTTGALPSPGVMVADSVATLAFRVFERRHDDLYDGDGKGCVGERDRKNGGYTACGEPLQAVGKQRGGVTFGSVVGLCHARRRFEEGKRFGGERAGEGFGKKIVTCPADIGEA